MLKALFRKEIDIREVNIINSRITGILAPNKEPNSPLISPINVRIGRLFFDVLFIDLKSPTTAQTYLINEGSLKVYEIKIAKTEPVSPAIMKQFDFRALAFKTVLSDSMYTLSAIDVNYSSLLNTLSIDTVSVHPNYSDYAFVSRYTYRMAHIDAVISQLSFNDFSAVDFVKNGNFICSSVEIGRLDMRILEDSHKKFSPENKTVFQERVNNYKNIIDIDSIGVYSGRITYAELVEEANKPAEIWFDKIDARIYKFTNDTLYKTEKGYLEFKADALIMSEAKIHVELKGRLYDQNNTFELSGTLSTLAASAMNSILEKNLSVFASSGTIDGMNFGFTANNTRSTGNMTLQYHELKITAANNKTGNTTAIKEKVISGIANLIVMDANPRVNEEIRTVDIDYERDPGAPFFDYCAKSLLSGIPPSLIKRHNKTK
jgi:hypothetical protein